MNARNDGRGIHIAGCRFAEIDAVVLHGGREDLVEGCPIFRIRRLGCDEGVFRRSQAALLLQDRSRG